MLAGIAGFEFMMAYEECGQSGLNALWDALTSGDAATRIAGAVTAYGCISAGLDNLVGLEDE